MDERVDQKYKELLDLWWTESKQAALIEPGHWFTAVNEFAAMILKRVAHLEVQVEDLERVAFDRENTIGDLRELVAELREAGYDHQVGEGGTQ